MPPKSMSNEHKAKLAEGRNESRAVKSYLDALEQNRPRRGRKRTADSIKKRIGAIEKESADASVLRRLQLVQERRDLEAEMAQMGTVVDTANAEADFLKVGKSYGARKGIAYATWRELGVPADVLRRAGVTRAG